MKLLLDMNIPQGWVEILNKAGHEATHWRDIGDIRAEDTEIMAWARENEYMVFTHDLDFGSILYATNATSPSVIQLRTSNISPSAVGDLVIKTLNTVRNELASGSLVVIDPKKHRVRLLALQSK